MLGNLTENVQYTLHMCQLSEIFPYCLCLFPYFLWLYIIGDDGQYFKSMSSLVLHHCK